MPDTPTQLKVFLSHSSLDRAACDQVVGALRDAGADVWYDEHNLGAGQLLEEIQRELQARPVFIVLLSKNAFASQWVRRETTWAFNLANREPNRLILPITVGAIEPSDFNGQWLFLEDYKRVEARGMQPHPHEEMIAQALRLLALTPKGQAPISVAPQPAESVSDLLTQGRALQAQQKHAEALPFFQRATQLDPNSFDAWANLGYALNSLGRHAEALPAEERATKLDPNNAAAWCNKGGALGSLGRFGEALAAFDRALALDPNLVDAWYNKGVALRNLGRHEDGIAAYDKALALDPNYADAWINKGNALYGLERHTESLAAYERATTLDPNNAIAWRAKGFPLRALGRNKEAEEAERRAQKLGG
jgi:tetratricopeptide (TPR) repeat protein